LHQQSNGDIHKHGTAPDEYETVGAQREHPQYDVLQMDQRQTPLRGGHRTRDYENASAAGPADGAAGDYATVGEHRDNHQYDVLQPDQHGGRGNNDYENAPAAAE